MKKISILVLTLCIILGSEISVMASNVNEGVQKGDTTNSTLSREEMINLRKAREAAFEQKLGLTDEQKAQAKELRKECFEKISPIVQAIRDKKLEARAVKLSRIAVRMQEEKLAVIDKEIASLQKQMKKVRKQNMKDFESILTRQQRKVLKQMKKDCKKQKYSKPSCVFFNLKPASVDLSKL